MRPSCRQWISFCRFSLATGALLPFASCGSFSTTADLETHFNLGFGYVNFAHELSGSLGSPSPTKMDAGGAALLDAQGRYLIVGSSVGAGGATYLVLYRYLANGKLDLSFNSTGFHAINFGQADAGGNNSGVSRLDAAYSVDTDTQGRYVFGGVTINLSGPTKEAVIWRYGADGMLDPTWGTGANGSVVFQHDGAGVAGAVNGVKEDLLASLRIDNEGRVVAVGSSKNATGNHELVIWRYLSSGELDTSFGGGAGYVLFQHGAAGASGASNASKDDFGLLLRIDSQGRYVVAGTTKNSAGGSELAIWRYNPSAGSFDTSFGSGGVTVFRPGAAGAAGAVAGAKLDSPRILPGNGTSNATDTLLIDGSDGIIVAGQSLNTVGKAELAIWRYTAAGMLDTSFGGGAGYVVFQNEGLGLAGASNSTKAAVPTSMQFDRNNRLVLAGHDLSGSLKDEMFLVRLGAGGTFDPDFGRDGVLVFNHDSAGTAGALVGSKSDQGFALMVDRLNRYVVVGASANKDGGNETTIWRFLDSGAINK